ncbi:MAG: nuclear transport factor 2 family protein [Pseudomonadota bacterium]
MSDPDFATFAAITRRLYEYAYGIDTRDWALYRSIFADEVHMDFSSYSGDAGRTVTADDWVRGVQPLFEGLDATQHSLSNPLVEVDGDRARCRMYMQAEHFLTHGQGDPSYAIGGYYDDQLIRTEAGWLITGVTLNVLWHRGNRHIMSLAVQERHQR